ncbi:MAG: GNAT family N-acetyltransferase [Geitlerinemataceae cyanobacterium]
MSFSVRAIDPANAAELDRFLDVPWSVYEPESPWVPPIRSDLAKQLSPENSFRSYGTLQAFVVAGEKPVGRVVAAVNRRLIDREGQNVGLLGYFECIDNEAAIAALLDAACDWLRSQGMTTVRGPIDLYTHNNCLFLSEGFESPPMLMMPYNPAYYGAAWERYGFARAKDAYAYDFPMIPLDDRFDRGYKIATKAGVTFRPIRTKGEGFEEDVRSLYRLFTDAFEASWSSSPRTEAEFFESAQQLKTLVDPEIFPIAEYDGKMVGFFMALPDYNIALKKVDGRLNIWGILKFLWYRRTIDRARVLAICALPEFRRKMVPLALIYLGMQGGQKQGYTNAELSWIWADNKASRNITEASGAKVLKTYSMYERAL